MKTKRKLNFSQWKELTTLYAWKDFYKKNQLDKEFENISREIKNKEKEFDCTLNDYYKK